MESDEFAYYRAVEDHFAVVRGTMFIFSPKDFHLLRNWWQDGVPLAAVLAGISEVAEKRREADGDPVSSLSYCRHAVVKHAKRLVAAHIGGDDRMPKVDVTAAIAKLSQQVRHCAEGLTGDFKVATIVAELAFAIESLPADAQPAAIEEALGTLELGMLDAVIHALPEPLRRKLDEQIDGEIGAAVMTDEIHKRTRRALLLKLVRERLGLPRIELSLYAS